ncbi:MAG: ABC transporter permease, partial [Chloroflexota bacterium]
MQTPHAAAEAIRRASPLSGTDPLVQTPRRPARPAAAIQGRGWQRQVILNGWRLLLTVILLAGWEMAATTVTTPFWISQPSRVFDRLLTLTMNGLLIWHIWATLQAALLGLALGGLAGVAFGLVLGAYPRVAAVLDPLMMGLNSLPRVALAPLFIIWFGIGLPSKVILAFSLVVFPVLINTYQGVRGVDRDLVDMLRTMQASPWMVARRVTIPSTLPWIFAGLRIGLGMSLIGAVVGELVGSSRGVGYYVEA